MSDPERKRSFDAEYANFEVQEQLLELMEKAQMSVRTLAAEAGLSKTTVQKFRTGEY